MFLSESQTGSRGFSSFNLVDRDSSTAGVGALFRRRRPGPESRLVLQFLEQLPLLPPRGCKITVFCEPRLESGFPDLVLVIWNVATANRWNSNRASLSNHDIRLLHFIHSQRSRSARYSVLRRLFPRRIEASLDRLLSARLVRKQSNIYAASSLSYAFAVRRIIAVEAKMSGWSAAVDQAFLNTWFASDSYVLLPRILVDRAFCFAKSRGVRICSPGDAIASTPLTPRRCLPRSYASWLFNEWAWRSSQDKGLPA